MPASPHGLIEIAVEPRSRAGQEALSRALAKVVAEDASFSFYCDQESGQTIIASSDERRLDLQIEALLSVPGVDINVGAPQIAYRETIGCRAQIDQTHKRQIGHGGEFARVRIAFDPGERGSGFWFKSECNPVPLDFISGVISGLEGAARDGLLAGFPLTDIQATLIDFAHHDINSSRAAFEVVARAAVRELRHKGAPLLLEPIMMVAVLTPDECVGDVIGDMISRRGQIQGSETRGDETRVFAMAPLANMFGYEGPLRAFTQDRASYTMQYDHYAPAPQPTDPPDDLFPTALGMRA